MNAETLKSLLIRDKLFLKELYEGNFLFNRKTLQTAEDLKIKTLLFYFHFLCRGLIPFHKSNFEKIPAYLIKLMRKTVESKQSFQKTLNESRLNKINFLSRYCKVFSFILYPLFNEYE